MSASDEVLIFEAERGNQGAVVAAMCQLRKRIETLDQNISGLLSAIHTLDRVLVWFTIAIFFFTGMQVLYDIFFHKP